MIYMQLGEKNGIGRTAHVMRVHDKTIAVDYGVEISKRGEFDFTIPAEGNYLKGHHVDLILITHDHLDHIGAMPRLVDEHSEALVLMSKQAFKPGIIMLEDNLKIYESESKKARFRKRPEPEFIFGYQRLEKFKERVTLVDLENPGWISPWPGWKIGYHSSGHSTGAVMWFIIPPKDHPILLTGDVSAHDQEIVKGVMLPDENFLGDFLERKDIVMIQETTNGSRPMIQPQSKTKEMLLRDVEAVKQRGGTVFFPAFARNRSGRIAMMMIEAGYAPHVDGLARKLVPYEIPNYKELIEKKKLILFEEDYETAAEHRRLLKEGNDPCGVGFSPIIAPSATLEAGYAVGHAEWILEKRENATFSTGYRFPGSITNRLFRIQRGRTITLNIYENRRTVKKAVNVRCDVKHYDFTSHDYQENLAKRVSLVKPEVLIMHHIGDFGFMDMLFELGKYESLRDMKIHEAKHMKKIII